MGNKLKIALGALILAFAFTANASSQLGDVTVNYDSTTPTNSTVTFSALAGTPYETLHSGDYIPRAIITAAYPDRRGILGWNGGRTDAFRVEIVGSNEAKGNNLPNDCYIKGTDGVGSKRPWYENYGYIWVLDESVSSEPYFGGEQCTNISISSGVDFVIGETTGNNLKARISNNLPNVNIYPDQYLAYDSVLIPRTIGLYRADSFWNSIIRPSHFGNQRNAWGDYRTMAFNSRMESLPEYYHMELYNSLVKVMPTSDGTASGQIGNPHQVIMSGSVWDGGGKNITSNTYFENVWDSYIANISGSFRIQSNVTNSHIFNNDTVNVNANSQHSTFFKNNHINFNGNFIVRSVFDTPGNVSSNFDQVPGDFTNGQSKVLTSTNIKESYFTNDITSIGTSSYPYCQNGYGPLSSGTNCSESNLYRPFVSAGVDIPVVQ